MARSTRHRQAVLRAAALTVLCGLILLFGAGQAVAHTRLLSSDPADGTSLAAAPEQVSLTFNEAMQPGFSTISVVGPDGATWQAGDVTVDGPRVSIGLRPLGPAGRYEIGYRVVSNDGHPVTGNLSFTLADPGPGAATSAPTPAADPAPSGPPAALGSGSGAPVWPWIVAAVVLVGGGVAAALRLGRG
ncbi:MAG: copper resistance CopC family protein [Pseudonocardia sp.]